MLDSTGEDGKERKLVNRTVHNRARRLCSFAVGRPIPSYAYFSSAKAGLHGSLRARTGFVPREAWFNLATWTHDSSPRACTYMYALVYIYDRASSAWPVIVSKAISHVLLKRGRGRAIEYIGLPYLIFR